MKLSQMLENAQVASPDINNGNRLLITGTLMVKVQDSRYERYPNTKVLVNIEDGQHATIGKVSGTMMATRFVAPGDSAIFDGEKLIDPNGVWQLFP